MNVHKYAHSLQLHLKVITAQDNIKFSNFIVIMMKVDLSKFEKMVYEDKTKIPSEEVNSIINSFIDKVKQERIDEELKLAEKLEPIIPESSISESSSSESITSDAQPGPSSECVMPEKRPTAIPMISNKRKFSARITQKLSPYILHQMQENGSMHRMENAAVELPYNGNMARIRPQKQKSDKERAQRDRNNVASRQSRLKAKLLEQELIQIADNVKLKNEHHKMIITMHTLYFKKLEKALKLSEMDLDAAWAKELEKVAIKEESDSGEE